MLSQPDSPNSPTTNPLSQLAQNMFSDNSNNIMLAAVISLLLVILFVLLLHIYAKWFLAQSHSQSQTRHRRRAPVTVSGFHHINIETPPISTKGLDSKIVSTIPTFIYEAKAKAEAEKAEELECVICLSGIEEGEIGRRLPKCGHAFHVECIDMWLSSHCNCPICRAPILHNNDSLQLGTSVDGDNGSNRGAVEIVIGTSNYEMSESGGVGGNYGVSGSVSVSETSLSLLGCSLKRMLTKVFLSSPVNEELDGSQ